MKQLLILSMIILLSSCNPSASLTKEKCLTKNSSNLSKQHSGKSRSIKDNKPIVFHLIDESINKVSHSPKDGINISNQLIIKPGTYKFQDNNYSLDKEGLYRFILPGTLNMQRIVYKDDVDALLSAMCWIVSHGNSDNKKSNNRISNKALHSKVFITCGHISKWAKSIFDSLDIESRLVAGMTTDDWNSYDNGHSLIEVYRNKWNKWVLYDLDSNSYFIPRNGKVPLSLLEFSKYIVTDDYRIVYLSSDTRVDISNFNSTNGYDYGFLSEAGSVNIRSWYRRVMQVPLIHDKPTNTYFCMSNTDPNRIESYSPRYKHISKNSFITKFYTK